MLWIISKGVGLDFDERGLPYCSNAYQLRKAALELGNWCYNVENGIYTLPLAPPSDYDAEKEQNDINITSVPSSSPKPGC
jgi:hypothetical protein